MDTTPRALIACAPGLAALFPRVSPHDQGGDLGGADAVALFLDLGIRVDVRGQRLVITHSVSGRYETPGTWYLNASGGTFMVTCMDPLDEAGTVVLHDVLQRKVVASFAAACMPLFMGPTLVMYHDGGWHTLDMATLQLGPRWEGADVGQIVCGTMAMVLLMPGMLRTFSADGTIKYTVPFEYPPGFVPRALCGTTMYAVTGFGWVLVDVATGAIANMPWTCSEVRVQDGIVAALDGDHVVIYEGTRLLRRVAAVEPALSGWRGRTVNYMDDDWLMELSV